METTITPAVPAGRQTARRASRMWKWLLTLVMTAVGLLLLLPFFWMISTSFKTPLEVFEFPIQWIPQHPVWKHHVNVWTGTGSFALLYMNSLKISILSTLGAVTFAALAAYGFSRIQFRGREPLFLIYLSMMMIPPQILFVPRFVLFNWMGIYNTHWALILPGAFTIFGVFLLRQFFITVPQEISEAAFIDGAGHFRIFTRVILPLAKAPLATLTILDFSWHWNDYENALIFLVDKNLYTVPLGLQNFVLENSVDYNGMMAAATAAMIPMIVVFLAGQKFIIQGIASGAVKG